MTFDEWVMKKHPEWIEQGKEKGMAYVREWVIAEDAWEAATQHMEDALRTTPLRDLNEAIKCCHLPTWVA